MRFFPSIQNRFLRWLLRCAGIGLLIGTLYAVVFSALSLYPVAFMLIPLQVGLSFVLGLIFWPAASRIQIHPQHRMSRILEGGVHGAIIGAIMFMPFSFLAIHQTVAGAFIGGVLGTVFATIFRWRTPAEPKRA